MHPIENIMQTSMEQIKRMVDVNTVVGNPIVTAGNTIKMPKPKRKNPEGWSLRIF